MISNKEKNNTVLLDSLMKYILPFFNKNIIKKKKQSKLEALVKEEKTKLKPLELIFLEDLINPFPKDKDIKIINKTKKQDTSQFIEIEKNNENNNDINEIINECSIMAERKKGSRDNFAYSVSIKYEENENEEKLNVKVRFDNYSKNEISKQINKLKDDKKEYSFTITKDKENKTKDNYSVNLVYENNYEKERLSITYKSIIGTYLYKRLESLQDFSDRVPGKHMNILPESVMGSILGFTYLGENFMARRADLTGNIAKMVDVHESIHTPNEYETRLLTSWIMTKEMPKYIK
jgi:hypothetical protein|tara:strand:- start:12928 stop:13803 length:876 start_codon:yes stop_codon:yes gene_type:complete